MQVKYIKLQCADDDESFIDIERLVDAAYDRESEFLMDDLICAGDEDGEVYSLNRIKAYRAAAVDPDWDYDVDNLVYDNTIPADLAPYVSANCYIYDYSRGLLEKLKKICCDNCEVEAIEITYDGVVCNMMVALQCDD